MMHDLYCSFCVLLSSSIVIVGIAITLRIVMLGMIVVIILKSSPGRLAARAGPPRTGGVASG